MYELFFIGLALLGFIYYLYNSSKSTSEIDILESVPHDIKNTSKPLPSKNKHESKTLSPEPTSVENEDSTIPNTFGYVSNFYMPESNDNVEMSVDDLLNQRHLNFFRFGYILDNGDEEQVLRLFKRLFNEYKDYDRIINIINKRKYLLEDTQIKEIYEDSLRFINMDDKKHKALVEGWRT